MGKARQPAVWGHRGASGDFPENTILAFRKALEAGAAGIEFDLQKTSDGRFVIIHDEELMRTTDGTGKVGDFTLAELKRLDAGGGETIPELGETLNALGDYPGITMDVELKEETLTPEDFRAVDAQLSAHDEVFHFHISSFEHRLLVPFSRAGYETGMLIGEQHEKEGIGGICRSIRQVRPKYLNLPVEIYDRLPAAARRTAFAWWRLRGIGLTFWTVNTEADFRRVRRAASAVIGDYPGKLLYWRDGNKK